MAASAMAIGLHQRAARGIVGGSSKAVAARACRLATSSQPSQQQTPEAAKKGGSNAAVWVVGTAALGAGGVYAWQQDLLRNPFEAAKGPITKAAAPQVLVPAVAPAAAAAPSPPAQVLKEPPVQSEAAAATVPEEAPKAPEPKPLQQDAAAALELPPEKSPEELAAEAAAQAAKEEAAVRAAEAARDVQQAAARSLAKVEAERQEALRRRDEASRTLKAALEKADPELLREALTNAKAAGLGTTADVLLAQSITAPIRMVAEGLTTEDVAELLKLPKELRGLSEAEAEAAELELCKDFTREELEARVLELTRVLATGRLHARAILEDALLSRLEAADAQSLRDLSEGLAKTKLELDKEADKQLFALQMELEQQQEDAVSKAATAAAEEALKTLEEERQRLLQEAEEAILQARADKVQEVISLSAGLASLEEVLEKDKDLVRRAHTYNSLSAAVLGLEDAIVSGRSARLEFERLLRAAEEAGDIFVSEILQRLPASAVQLCQSQAPIPTEPLLRQQLAGHLPDLASAAFVPPSSGLLGEVVGRAFRWLYFLHRDALLPAEASEAGRNLQALSEAARVVGEDKGSGGSLLDVLSCLEKSLAGHCRTFASPWLTEARAALQVRQMIIAVKARVQCLNSTLA